MNSNFARSAVVVSLCLLGASIGGCTRTGDFGRAKPSYFHDNLLPGVRSFVHDVRGLKTSNMELTPAEQELRALSRTLREPQNQQQKPGAIKTALDDVGIRDNDHQQRRRIQHDTGRAAYEARGPARRAGVLLSRVEADVVMLRRFSVVADRVYQADAARRAALGGGLDRSADDIVDTTGRIEENRRVVADTIVTLENRTDDYRLEARRGELQHPGGGNSGIVTAIDRLESNVHRLRVRLRRLTQYNTAARMPARLHRQ